MCSLEVHDDAGTAKKWFSLLYFISREKGETLAPVTKTDGPSTSSGAAKTIKKLNSKAAAATKTCPWWKTIVTGTPYL